MKLFKKLLSHILSIGLVVSCILPLHIFADVPTNLEECCLELDKILSLEEKAEIKQSSACYRGGYIYEMAFSRLGWNIRQNWLYQPLDGSKRSPLAKLLLEHGADFLSETDFVMTGIILENYSHYLNGESVASIEDLVIDHWYTFSNHFKTKEDFQKMMIKYKQIRESRGNPIREQIKKRSVCTIL